jgi:hypothetical protein
MSQSTENYLALVVKRDVNGAGGYRYKYHIGASDSGLDGYRILSAVGPRGYAIKEHWLAKDQDDQAAVDQRVRSWHPDLDILQLKKK